MIEGCTVVLAGPPNSGKSTLFNSLCGKARAIVTDTKGTTRDWVSAWCRMERLSVELIDTAGLDAAVAGSDIDSESQARAADMLKKADVVLLVLDASEAAEAIDYDFADKKVVTVLNKIDMPVKLDTSGSDDVVSISAKEGTGLEIIVERITEISGVDGFESKAAVCFTQRQRRLLEELARAESAGRCGAVIAELLNGTLAV
jgi:tRNA modification GTPase